MATLDSEQMRLLELETAYWEAFKRRDGKAAMALSTEDCVVTGAQGFGKISRQHLADMVDDARYELLDYQIGEGAEVQLVGKDVAIVAYKVREELLVEGKEVTIDAADSSTWVRRDGTWLCALHTESILGDPFGRDRLPQHT
jgi:uncharacterized protein (TIGR02246 family)